MVQAKFILLRGLSFEKCYNLLSIPCVDNSITDLSLSYWVCYHCVYTLSHREQMCSASAKKHLMFSHTHHATAPHTITHTANRCHVQRLTTNSNIWVLDQPWMPESSERPHTANTSRMQQCCHVCRTQVLMGIWIVKRPSWAQRQAETQPNVSHPLKSPPTRMLLHQHCVYVRVCEWECGRVMPRCWCLCGLKGLTEPLQAKKIHSKTVVFTCLLWDPFQHCLWVGFPYFLYILNKPDTVGLICSCWGDGS